MTVGGGDLRLQGSLNVGTANSGDAEGRLTVAGGGQLVASGFGAYFVGSIFSPQAAGSLAQRRMVGGARGAAASAGIELDGVAIYRVRLAPINGVAEPAVWLLVGLPVIAGWQLSRRRARGQGRVNR